MQADYETMVGLLVARGHKVYIPELSRLDWITGLLPSAVSKEYWTGELQPSKTLGFYYEACDQALATLKDDFSKSPFHIVGHSLGGWVGRGWLSERCSDEDRKRALTFTTLGTPHRTPPESSPFASFDQTRGLLASINKNYPGAFFKGISYTSVIGVGVKGKVPSGVLEEMFAFVSYLPLCGQGTGIGDGVVPWETGILEGSESILLERTVHADFLPTPGKAVPLPLRDQGYQWYGCADGLPGWAHVLDEAEAKRASSTSKWLQQLLPQVR